MTSRGGGHHVPGPRVLAGPAAVLTGLVAVLALVAACSPGSGRAPRTPGAPDSSAPASSTPAATVTPPPPQVAIAPADGAGRVLPGRVVRVVVTGGTLHSVEVRGGGQRVAGTYDRGRHRWHSTATLHVATRYTVVAVAVDPSGWQVVRRSRFRTLVPAATVGAQITEQDGAIYGVGMPIQVGFTRPITDRAAVERALHVTTSVPVVGAWYWLDDQHVDFRPRDYWPAHVRVSVTAALDGVRAAPGVFGTEDVTRSFRIGASLIVVADTVTHRLRLYRGGVLIDNWPISTGRPGDDTPNGTYLTIDKANPVEMRPAGIAPGEPGYYDLWVPWSVRFTWNGDYLHAASWSVAEQGHVNVSHGCVNMPPAAAETYYRMEVPGDPVTITGSPVAGDPANGWTDWFATFDRLLASSALHLAVVAGPGGSVFTDPTALPPSTARAPLGRPAAHNAAATG